MTWPDGPPLKLIINMFVASSEMMLGLEKKSVKLCNVQTHNVFWGIQKTESFV